MADDLAQRVTSAPSARPPAGHAREANAEIGLDLWAAEPEPRPRPRWILPLVLAAADLVALSLAVVIAEALVPAGADRWALALVVCTWLPLGLIVLAAAGLYGRDSATINHRTLDEATDLLRLATVGTALFVATLWVADVARPRIGPALTLWCFVAAALLGFRGIARATLRRRADLRQRTLIVGAGTVGQLIGHKLLQHPEYGVDLLGFVDAAPRERRDDLEDLTVLGAPEQLTELVHRLGVDRVIVAFSQESHEDTVDVIRTLHDLDVQVDLVPRLFEVIPPTVTRHAIGAIPLIALPRLRLSRTARSTKRALDVVLTVVSLIALAPLFAVLALLIKLDSRGPVLFRQVRMGEGEKTFEMFKFRTMVEDADAQKHRLAHLNRHARPGGDPRMFKVEQDPRVTRVGGFLRRTSLDELPQLLNVLRGEMSLVGPRPLILDEDRHVESWGRKRLVLKPGMTGLWQVSGRSSLPFAEMVTLDYLYVASWSLGNDIRLMLRTLPLVVGGDAHGG